MRRELDRTLYLQARFEGRTMHMNRISTLITRTKALMRVEAEYRSRSIVSTGGISLTARRRVETA